MDFDIQKLLSESPFLAIFVVFWAGAIASMSSCTLIRIPLIFSYIAGYSDSKRKATFIIIFFVLGLVLSYTVLGILLGLLGQLTSQMINYSKYIFWVLGALLIIAGLIISGLLKIKIPIVQHSIGGKFKVTGIWGAFIFGVFLALVEMPTCPCCAPVLMIIASTVFISGSYLYAIMTFVSFAIGQSLPTLVIGMSSTLMRFLTPKLEKFESAIRLVAGNIIIAIGIYFVIIA
ncbi:MAG: cytochrome c biogenesis CcdA family protein [Candidatus Poribacteria bacterium]